MFKRRIAGATAALGLCVTFTALPESALAINLEDLALVHVTSVKPSLSDDQKSLVMKTGGSTMHVRCSEDGIEVIRRDFSKPRRSTLHWSLCGVTWGVGFETGDGKKIFASPARYAVIEPITSFRGSLWGGSFDDLYSIGDHELSKDAYLLMPEDDPDIALLAQFVHVVPLKHVPRWATNEDMRGPVAELLERLKKPRIYLNGLFLTASLLSERFKVSVPAHFSEIPLKALGDCEEFMAFNRGMLANIITGAIELGGTRMFVCRMSCDFNHSDAIFIMPDGKTKLVSHDKLERILRVSGYLVPELGVSHPVSQLMALEKRLGDSYAAGDTNVIIDELLSYVLGVYLKNRLTPPQGFYQIIQRMKEAAVPLELSEVNPPRADTALDHLAQIAFAAQGDLGGLVFHQ